MRLEGLRKTTEMSVRIGGARVKIRIGYLLNVALERYRYWNNLKEMVK
jgi:hypothetical protein